MDPERVLDDARSVCLDLRSLFEQPGGHDPDEVERLCEIAQLVIEDPRCRQDILDVQRYARHLLLGDHRRWVRGSIAGRDILCELILDLLRGIDVRLASLALKQHAMQVRRRAQDARREGRAIRARVHA